VIRLGRLHVLRHLQKEVLELKVVGQGQAVVIDDDVEVGEELVAMLRWQHEGHTCHDLHDHLAKYTTHIQFGTIDTFRVFFSIFCKVVIH
jgi:hypothetical protein